MLRHDDPGRANRELVAAELSRRLHEVGISADGSANRDASIWFVTPAQVTTAGLSTVLGIARRLGVALAGFIDAAAVSAAALNLTGNVIVLEFGLHHAAAVLVEVSAGSARRREALVADGAGLLAVYQCWLDLISATLIRQARFDPLHAGAGEQQLFDGLPQLAAAAAREGTAAARVGSGSAHYDLTLTRGELVRAAQPVLDRIADLVHRLRPAGTALDILAPAQLTGLPGAAELFDAFANCRLHALTDGYGAAAASVLGLPVANGTGSVKLLRRVPARPMDAGPLSGVELPECRMIPARPAPRATPSHVLFADHAFALDEGAVVVGRGVEGPGTVTVPEGSEGVSRRHCTLLRTGQEVTLIDHSTHGSYVNGERVAGRVRVHAGDHIRVGDPGVLLSLLALGSGAAVG